MWNLSFISGNLTMFTYIKHALLWGQSAADYQGLFVCSLHNILKASTLFREVFGKFTQLCCTKDNFLGAGKIGKCSTILLQSNWFFFDTGHILNLSLDTNSKNAPTCGWYPRMETFQPRWGWVKTFCPYCIWLPSVNICTEVRYDTDIYCFIHIYLYLICYLCVKYFIQSMHDQMKRDAIDRNVSIPASWPPRPLS